jgi:hypothetical protein
VQITQTVCGQHDQPFHFSVLFFYSLHDVQQPIIHNWAPVLKVAILTDDILQDISSAIGR